jgi:flagellin FlaB
MGVAIAPASNRITYVNISVATTAGGTPLDLSQMVVSYVDSNQSRNPNVQNNSEGISSCTWTHAGDTNILVYDSSADWDVHWCVSQKINTVGVENNLLEPNEIWVLSIAMPPSATPNTQFTINFQPSVGAVLPISRTVPGGITKIQALY